MPISRIGTVVMHLIEVYTALITPHRSSKEAAEDDVSIFLLLTRSYLYVG
jgi:hypothetical protein